jgi:hypothetical protein
MIDSKFVFTLVGLIATILAVCKINPTHFSGVKENFGVYPLTQKLVNIRNPQISPIEHYGEVQGNFSVNVDNAKPKTESRFYQKYANMVTESFTDDNSSESLDTDVMKGMQSMPVDATTSLEYPSITTIATVTSMKGRTKGQGDFVRGDLPIHPCKNGMWDVSTADVSNLQPGYLSMISGANMGDTARLISSQTGVENTLVE